MKQKEQALPAEGANGATRQVLRAAAPALILAVLVLVPFLSKPFTTDDPVFLAEARHALSDPLHPTAFEMTWYHAPERVSKIVPTGPVMGWLLIPSVLVGGAEWLAHLVQLGCLLGAVLATVSLALRLGVGPPWAMASGLLLVSSPAVLGMAGTAMPDVPAMALGVLGIERLVSWRQQGRLHQAVSAALLLGVAPLARSHLAALFGVAAMFCVDDVFSPAAWRSRSVRRWLPLLGALVVMIGLGALTSDPGRGGGSIGQAALGLSSWKSLGPNVVAFVAHWVLAMAFALPWAVVRAKGVLLRPWVLVAATAGAAVVLGASQGLNAPYWVAPVAGLGAAVLVDVLMGVVRRRDGAGFVLGLWLLLALPAAVYVHLPAKFLLASAPAAAILVARALAERPHLGRTVLVATTLVGVALGVAILRADAVFAGLGRTAAERIIRPLVASGKRVWFVGHWGYHWYAEQAGARYFTSTPPYPAIGDLVVSSQNSEPSLVVEEMDGLVRLSRTEDRTPGGRIMSREAGAGFFSNLWGYLPWSWGSDVIDAFDVWVVDPQPRLGLAEKLRGSIPR